MRAKAAVIAGSVVLAIVAAVVVVGVARERAARPEAEKVVCVVCGMEGAAEDMLVEPIDSIGIAPDQVPVWVCSEECAEAVKRNPEAYRQKAIQELEGRGEE